MNEHLQLVNLLRNSSVLPVYFLWQILQVKRQTTLLEAQFNFCGLMCFGNMFTNFTPWFTARTTETLLGFNWMYFGSHQNVLRTLPFFKTC